MTTTTSIISANRQCSAFAKGSTNRCRMSAVRGSDYCYIHDPARATERAESRRRGGKARHGRTIGSTGAEVATPIIEITSAGDILLILAGELQAMLSLEKSLNRGRTVAALATVALRAFETSELEQRLAALEELIKSRGNL